MTNCCELDAIEDTKSHDWEREVRGSGPGSGRGSLGVFYDDPRGGFWDETPHHPGRIPCPMKSGWPVGRQFKDQSCTATFLRTCFSSLCIFGLEGAQGKHYMCPEHIHCAD